MEGKATSKVKIGLSLGPGHNSALEVLHVSSVPPQPVHAKNHIIINHLQHSQVCQETLTCYLHVYSINTMGRQQHLTSWSGYLHLKVLRLIKLTQQVGKLFGNKIV